MNPLQFLKKCKTFADFLRTIRDEEGYELCHDNGWTWVEYQEKEIEGTAKERFSTTSEINTLLHLAMHDTFFVVTNENGVVLGVADSPESAFSIYEQAIGHTREQEHKITAYKLNKLHLI